MSEGRNFLDRAAYFDGRVDGLTDAMTALTEAMETMRQLGEMPSPARPPMEILSYQVRAATAAGAVFRVLSERMLELSDGAKRERRVLLREQANDRGEEMH